VAVPQAIAAAAVAHAYDRSGSFAEVIKRGVRQARQIGAQSRAAVLETVQTQGARALTSPSIARPLLHVAGVSEGGLLTLADLAAVHNLDVAAMVCPTRPSWLVPPWSNETADRDSPDERSDARGSVNDLAVLCAVDSRGIFAGACYQCSTGGIPIEELELELPTAAQPVLRGVTRLAPGVSLAAAASLAVMLEGNTPVRIAADTRMMHLSESNFEATEISLTRNPTTRIVTTIQRS
jgi:hypothetical protein